MLLEFSLVVLSLVLLYLGAEGLVRGSASLALRFGLPPLVVGLTVVAFGTSSPELVVSIKAALAGQGDIAMGNVVGSNIVNIGLILGLTAMICPITIQFQLIKFDVPVMIAVSLLLPLLLWDGVLSRLDGTMLFSGIIIYMIASVIIARRTATAKIEHAFEETVPKASRHWALDLGYIVAGLVILVFGSELLVDNSVAIARAWGMSEAMIGLTIIAAGTSMPELATSVVAAWKKEPDIAVGNVVGSCIFNILCILGATSLITPVVASGIKLIDFGFMIGLAAACLPFLWSGLRINRLEGVALLGAYIAYIFLILPK